MYILEKGKMEFASLQDAFPQVVPKKKSRKPKEGFQAYEVPPTDPDRPAVKRMLEIPPINPSLDSKDDPTDEFMDESTKFQKKMTVNNSLPPPRSTIQLEKDSHMPAFFGAEPFTNPSEDGRAPFNSHVDNPNGYMLDADFTKSFDQTGFGRSNGVTLPVPELRQRWKPLSADRVDTAFTNTKKSLQFEGLDMSEVTAMKLKINELMARLDDLEYRSAGANPQLEMLSFIMTGLFLMFALDTLKYRM
jgi:hypothetical protein